MLGSSSGSGTRSKPSSSDVDFARDVVRRRSETAGNENQIRPLDVLVQSIANRRPIGDRHLALDPQAERENLARDEAKVSVDYVAEQDFGAGVYDEDAH